MKSLVLFAALVMAAGTALAEEGEADTAARKQWVEATAARLKTFKPSEKTKLAEVRSHPGIGRVRYTIEGEGLIRLDDGQWLYVVTHSSHDEKSPFDAIMAVDHEKHIYGNDAHVCDEIWVDSRSGEPFATVEELLAAGVSKEPWRKR